MFKHCVNCNKFLIFPITLRLKTEKFFTCEPCLNVLFNHILDLQKDQLESISNAREVYKLVNQYLTAFSATHVGKD